MTFANKCLLLIAVACVSCNIGEEEGQFTCDFPKCLSDLVNTCAASNSCTLDIDQPGMLVECYSNGVEYRTSFAGQEMQQVSVRKQSASGSDLCFTVTGKVASIDGVTDYLDATWKDPKQTIVAVGRTGSDPNKLEVECMVGGEKKTIDERCAHTAPSSPRCDRGSCQ